VKILLYLMVSVHLLYASVYYSKVEPFKIKNISSDVSGKVLFCDEDLIGKKLSKKAFIKIDDVIDRAQLKDVVQKLQYAQESLEINKKILTNLQEILKKKRVNYKKTEALKIKSRIDKDREFYDLVTSENTLYATHKEINNLKSTIADLQLKKIELQKSIHDKKIIENGYVLYSIAVKEGEFVNKATPLAKVADTSKALLTIYVDAEILKGIDKRVVYIDDKKTNYRVSRVLDIADSVNISKYKVQIVIKPPKIFSQLVKVELKEE